MYIEVNALSTTVDHIAAVAINAMVQTTLHDYFTSRLFFFSVISHVKIVILTHIKIRPWFHLEKFNRGEVKVINGWVHGLIKGGTSIVLIREYLVLMCSRVWHCSDISKTKFK